MIPSDPYRIIEVIKDQSLKSGFLELGFSRAAELKEDGEILQKWLDKGYHAGMGYMENHFEKRINPTKLMDHAKTVISFLLSYSPKTTLPKEDNYQLSRYAYGQDYHDIIRNKLREVVAAIEAEIGPIAARVFTDSAPVLDRRWAEKAGLGWIGKNSCLIHPRHGSWFFIGEIITDLELPESSDKVKDFCGGCRKCIEACPTGAITEAGTLDSNKCISYLTIENREEIPESFAGDMNGWIYGCDICQEVCPWNRISKPHTEPSFDASEQLMEMRRADWDQMDETLFKQLFKGSAVKRAGFKGLRRNIDFLKNSAD